jgi:hypothetical protein
MLTIYSARAVYFHMFFSYGAERAARSPPNRDTVPLFRHLCLVSTAHPCYMLGRGDAAE